MNQAAIKTASSGQAAPGGVVSAEAARGPPERWPRPPPRGHPSATHVKQSWRRRGHHRPPEHPCPLYRLVSRCPIAQKRAPREVWIKLPGGRESRDSPNICARQSSLPVLCTDRAPWRRPGFLRWPISFRSPFWADLFQEGLQRKSWLLPTAELVGRTFLSAIRRSISARNDCQNNQQNPRRARNHLKNSGGASPTGFHVRFGRYCRNQVRPVPANPAIVPEALLRTALARSPAPDR